MTDDDPRAAALPSPLASSSASPADLPPAGGPPAGLPPAGLPPGGSPSADGLEQPAQTLSTSDRPAVRMRKHLSFWHELPFLVLIALVLALLIKAFLIQAFYIPSGSMENTLRISDRVLVNKLIYKIRSIHRGEIIVFKGPPSWAAEVTVTPATNPVQRVLRSIGGAIGVAPPGERDFIKRVIGIPGDTVACCDPSGRVTVNGYPLTEPYIYPGEHPSDTPFDVTVPPGRLFVMGDHRADSADSRDPTHRIDHNGTIPIKDVIGRAFVIVWPLGHLRTLSVPGTFHQPGLTAKAAAIGFVGAPYALGAVAVLPLATWRRRCRRRRRRRQ